MDINFEYYKIFYYVAKYRNITKAAKALDSTVTIAQADGTRGKKKASV